MAYTVYSITHHIDEQTKKSYVGLTRRTLTDRLNAHFNESTRKKPRGLSQFSLGFAIRTHLENDTRGERLRQAFEIKELEVYPSVEKMLEGEGSWIEKLDTMAPSGYNVMRGGSSAGGPSNSKPCEIYLGDGMQKFTSIASATEAAAKFLGITDENELRKYQARVRARMNYKAGQPWTLAEALELEPREDFRKTELSKVAKASGENLDTARSRQYRKRLAQNLAGVKKVRMIPHPHDLAVLVSIAEAAKLLGVPHTTLRWRLDQIRPRISGMQPQDIISYLQTAQNREKPFEILLPGETTPIRLGRNALAKEYARKGHSFSVIKTRLRKLGAAPTNDELLVAIGLKAAPPRTRIASVKTISRKKHCDDWTISSGESSHQFPNQAAFVRASADLLMKYPTNAKHLGKSPNDATKVRKNIQSMTTRMTKDGKSPREVADFLGILEALSNYGK